MRILITGASGQTGFEVIRYLYRNDTQNQLVAGVKNISTSKLIFIDFPKLEFVNFDFDNNETYLQALNKIDLVFLLHPPHIADTEKYFAQLIRKIQENGIKKILFLSVQGAEKSKMIPHYKIEKLILKSGIDYIFLRPSYFMQNLTNSFILDILQLRKIILPAGKARFNWIDMQNVGEVSAILLDQYDKYKNQAFEITGSENLNFDQVANLISTEIQYRIEYTNVNPIRFYNLKLKTGMIKGMILAMIILHFLPRFTRSPRISNFYEKLTGKKPVLLKEFIKRERSSFIEDDLHGKSHG